MSDYRDAKGCLNLGSENEVMRSILEMRGDNMQTCEEFVKENIPIWGAPIMDKNVLLAIPLELARRIDEQAQQLEKPEKLVVAQSTEIAKLMKLAGVK